MIAKIDSLNQLLVMRDRELQDLKFHCKGGLQELQKQYQQLQRDLAREQKHRQQLGQSNKSLGAYKGHFYRAQQKITLLKQENHHLKKQVKLLEFKPRKTKQS
jgi:hypothetical protein